MNLCAKCMHTIGLYIPHPQLIKPVEFCDGCGKERKSFSVNIVTIQLLVDKGIQ